LPQLIWAAKSHIRPTTTPFKSLLISHLIISAYTSRQWWTKV
jgi:hypothetical protein